MESSRPSSVVDTARGFTLVELIVVLALIVIITLIVITSQHNYNRSLIITNTAYSIALSLREAQSLGLSSRTFNTIQNAGYGVNFNETDMTKYRVFGDVSSGGAAVHGGCPTGTPGTPEQKPGNCLYNATTEILTTFNLNRGFKIEDFCGIRTIGKTPVCASDTGTTNWRQMNVVFLRPNTESIMTMVSTSNTTTGLDCAVIWIQSPGADPTKKCVVVSQVGQVSVPQTCPAKPFTACP